MDMLDAVARQVRRAPDSPALTDHRGTRFTYAELDSAARAAAGALTSLGVRPGDRVGLVLPRTADLFVLELAVLLAGACFTPLDQAQPPDRLRLLLKRASVALLITDDEELAGAAGVPTIRPEGLPARGRPAPPDPGARPEDPAYCLFTSGSTGTPVGTLISRAALDVYVAAFARLVGASPRERGAQIGSPGFDVTIDELWPFLSTGASVHIASDTDRSSPRALVDWLRANRITQTYVPPLLLESIFRLDGVDLGDVRLIRTGGERLAAYPPPGFPSRVLNEYGPTETVAGAVFCDVSAWPDRGVLPPIGTPLPHIRASVRDPRGKPVAPGTPGELYLGGPTVGIGYVGDDERTAHRFVEVDGERCFRTGDLVRELPTGDLEFLRRLDDQVQLFGKRVELGETESAAVAHPAVRRAAVAAPTDDAGRAERLVCFVEWQPGHGDADTDDLRAHLSRLLPGHMVPTEVRTVDRLPTTPAGKIDRRALLRARPGPPRPAPTPQALVRVWERVLGVTGLTVHSDFFLHGGDSARAVSAVTEIGLRLGLRVSVRDVFVHPTPAELAERLTEENQ
ncbi:non-ribosomal peptide synthetase [Streptomyces sparsogenes]|uniref:NRPS/PKS hybrid n=2 Tax=Streptomyces sparsogenes TaxID=67365 RepID=A0A1R1SAM5_9ACTN|nr:non-ribosomal peptide synthetase [Streptomyces sparsogenes]AKG47585.1 SpsQ [Streptomyces sparsogenes]OMI35300.1 NRPS/PKS hybrid [Streptomyces sparsogenes DSM 40356]